MLSYLRLWLVELGDDLVHPPGGVLDDGADGLEVGLVAGLAIKNPPKKNKKNSKKNTKNGFFVFLKFFIFYENNTNFSL
jgi:hypothetical protein